MSWAGAGNDADATPAAAPTGRGARARMLLRQAIDRIRQLLAPGERENVRAGLEASARLEVAVREREGAQVSTHLISGAASSQTVLRADVVDPSTRWSAWPGA